MNFFMKEENVDKYIKMVKDYDSSEIINKLRQYLKEGSSLLELGMGPGKDLEMLSKFYKVVGSDNSPVFIDKFNSKGTSIEVILLDAIEMNTEKKFDCIYSNKVLQHLTKKDFMKSLKNQIKNLNNNGIVFMTLWKGTHREEIEFNGEIRFTYYLEEDIREIVKDDYEIVKLESYTEEANEDSLLAVLRKKL